MTNELWKPVKGFEGIYEVSNMGRVKSLPRPFVKKERILKPHFCKRNGYPYVILHKGNGEHTTYRIHVLVMSSFTDFVPHGYDPYCQIDHVNGIKSDNRLENLELVTQSENMKRAYKTGIAKSYKRKVICLDDGKIYESVTEAARDNDGLKNGITRACRGDRIQYKGKRYAYYEDYLHGTIPAFKGSPKRSGKKA